jgi:hypothetical protein
VKSVAVDAPDTVIHVAALAWRRTFAAPYTIPVAVPLSIVKPEKRLWSSKASVGQGSKDLDQL